MTLRSKTLAIIGLTLAGMTAVVYAVLAPLLLSSYASLEERAASNELSRAVDALYSEISTLENRVADTAEWDDTYNFVQDRNRAYIESTLVDNSFLFSRLNLVAIVNTAGEVVYEEAFDLTRNVRVRVPSGFHQHLAVDGPLLRDGDGHGTRGVLTLPDGPMLIVSRPILNSASQGPSRGRLIMGRFLDDLETKRLAEVTHLSIATHTVNDPDLSSDVVSELTGPAAGPATIRARDENSLVAYRMLNDIYGSPALIFRVNLPREIYHHGLTSVRYLLGSLLAAGLVFGAVTLLLIEKFVLSRLARLSSGVAGISGSADASTRLQMSGGDEVASLTGGINQMLAALERSQALLQERDERFQVVTKATNDTIWDWDLRTDRCWWNENVQALCGYSADQVEPDISWWYEHLHPDDRGRVVSSVHATIAGGVRHWTSEYRFRRADGTYAYVLDRGYILLDSTGIPIRMIGAMADMTERQRTASALLQLAAIVESSDDAIIGCTLEGAITNWNAGAERLYGYAAEEVVGNSALIIVPPDRGSEIGDILERIKRGEHIRNLETTRFRRDGRRIEVMLTVSPLKAADGRITGASAIVRDITERKQLEEQFRQSQKMEAVGGLAGGIAHDFNNLLTAIIGYSELVLDRLAEGDPLRADITEISKAADRAALLTRQLLAFSRRQMLRPEVLDLNAVLTDMSTMLRRVIGEDISLDTTFEPALGRVKADPGQIAQVIMNLAVNARDAMPAGGTLTLETAGVLLPDPVHCEDPHVPPGRYVRLTVADTGMGMSASTRDRAFEPFFTTKEQGKGTGLGLSTVYGIVKQSGGFVSLDSEPGCGARFRIYLPEAAPAPELLEENGVSAANGGTETILLVEDEETVRDLARRVLVRHGYRVLDAGHPHQAQSIFERYHHEVDLLLTDVTMPDISGVDLAKAIIARSPNTKVLYMSGYSSAVTSGAPTGLLAPGTDFLQKPFTPDALARKVREVFASSPLPARSRPR